MVAIVELRPSDGGQQLSVKKLVGALIRLYCQDLPRDRLAIVKARLESAARPPIGEAHNHERFQFIGKRKAAMILGSTVGELKPWCCDAQTRRSLGGPSPFGDDLRFLKTILETRDGRGCEAYSARC